MGRGQLQEGAAEAGPLAEVAAQAGHGAGVHRGNPQLLGQCGAQARHGAAVRVIQVVDPRAQVLRQ